MKAPKTIAVYLSFLLSLILTPGVASGLSETEIDALNNQLKTRGATFTVGSSSATHRDLADLCGLRPHKNWELSAPFKDLQADGDLPSTWNWCDEGACPPVRDQGTCGACWRLARWG